MDYKDDNQSEELESKNETAEPENSVKDFNCDNQEDEKCITGPLALIMWMVMVITALFYLSAISAMAFMVSMVLTIYTRIRYRNNAYGKVTAVLLIVTVVFIAIVLAVVVQTCMELCAEGCGGFCSFMPR